MYFSALCFLHSLFQLEATEHPLLWKACKTDIKSLKCFSEDSQTAEDVFECLRKHKTELSGHCRQLIFGREKAEFAENVLDARLQETCREEIEMLCRNVNPDRVLHCLKVCNALLLLQKVSKALSFVYIQVLQKVFPFF